MKVMRGVVVAMLMVVVAVGAEVRTDLDIVHIIPEHSP